ncbi:zincin-like metallopeptidase domain-containing protein [Nitrosomonas communis]|uniref:zincin-like metallopeptidase domain-containing protein n=1 Tax=Nitrosomonas communis TaxID=44574 RepID=UPI003D2A732C
MNKTSKPFPEQVAEQLIEQLKQGTAPWQVPWEPGNPDSLFPMNPSTGKRYRGINALVLMSRSSRDEYRDQRWMTYKQAIAAGAQVRKGEKGTTIQYWKFTHERNKVDENGKPVLDDKGETIKELIKLECPRVFYAVVFNAEQIEGLPPRQQKEQQWNALARAEHILQVSGARILHGGQNSAFYRPTTDSIHLPDKGQFPSADGYYATALHELGHWTGHSSRLDRDLTNPFGSEGYAKEELRAEIASMILGDGLGIGYDPGQHAAYVGSWIKILQDDPLEIFRAAADAEKIQEYLLAFEQRQEHTKTVQPTQLEAHLLTRNESSPILELQARYAEGLKQASGPILTEEASIAVQENAVSILEKERLLAGLSLEESLSVELAAIIYRQYQTGQMDTVTFAAEIERALGIAPLPLDWSGRVQVQGNILEKNDVGDTPLVVPAASIGVQPEFWSVYAQRTDGTYQWLADFPDQQQAETIAGKLALVDAVLETNEYEKAVKFARIHEERVRRDPTSNDEEISEAKEARKTAEFNAMLKDEDLQQRIANYERQQRTAEVREMPTPSNAAPEQARTYLAVPYEERIAAKAAGALWDKAVKAWYIGPRGDELKLKRWMNKGISVKQGSVINPRQEFADALRSLGCLVDGEHPIMDGTKQRITTEGDKSGEKSGFYVGHLDGYPAGYIKNNRTGIEMKWRVKGYSLKPEEKASLFADVAIKRAERVAGQERMHEAIAQRLQQKLESLVSIESMGSITPYLQTKGVTVQAGVMTDQEGRTTYIPAFDTAGKLWTMQTILEDGVKRFAKDSRKEGCFHVVGGQDTLRRVPVLVIAEGYATASSLSQALGFATVAAFDSGNLVTVTKALHHKFPDKPIVIAGDDDKHREATLGINPGRSKAAEAAEAVGGMVIFPIFAPGEQAARPEAFTDFNDLANNSRLGEEGVKRQVAPLVERLIRERQVLKAKVQPEQVKQEIRQKRVLTR